LSALVHCLTDYCNFSFLVTGKTTWISRNFFATAVGITVLYLIFTPQLGFVGAAIALLVAESVQFLFMQRAAKPLFDMQIHVRPFLTTTALAAIAYVIGGLVLRQPDLILDIGVKALIYVVCAALLVLYMVRDLSSASVWQEAVAPLLGRLPGLRVLLRPTKQT
jgi:O-antigen/teichoic acid export membrane protein